METHVKNVGPQLCYEFLGVISFALEMKWLSISTQ